MKKVLLILFFVACFHSPSFAYETGMEIEVKNITADTPVITKIPYAFATMPNAKTGAVFFTLANPLETDDTLIEAQSDIAEFVELHQNYIDPDDGMMMMRKVSGINVKAKDRTVLDPTGFHIMLINLNKQLSKDSIFDMTLIFESGHKIDTKVLVVPPGTDPKMFSHDIPHIHPEEKLINFSDTYLQVQ